MLTGIRICVGECVLTSLREQAAFHPMPQRELRKGHAGVFHIWAIAIEIFLETWGKGTSDSPTKYQAISHPSPQEN